MSRLLILPELIPLLAGYLDDNDLLACIRVNQAWHSAFIPFIWKLITLGHPTPSRRPTISAMKTHAQYIPSAIGHHGFTEEYASLHFPHLQALILDVRFSTTKNISISPSQLDQNQAFFIRQHLLTLTHLEIKGQAEPSTTTLWQVIAESTHWETIKLDSVAIHQHALQPFWKAIGSCSTLALTDVNLVGFSSTSSTFWSIPFPMTGLHRLRRISLWNVSGLTLHHQLDLLQLCPHLRDLTWVIQGVKDEKDSRSETLKEFAQVAATGFWRDLDSLYLGSFISDEDLARVLGVMARVRQLHVKESGFGAKSFAVLRPHFGWIEKFEIGEIVQPIATTSAMVLEILTSCPNLKVLTADCVLGSDIVQGAPWVATKLERLGVYFVLDGTIEMQKFVFERLSCLVKLFALVIRPPRAGLGREWGGHALEFRLEKGLSILVSLRKMFFLSVKWTGQEMGIEDAQWMMRSWTGLKYIQGQTHSGWMVHAEIEREFKTRKIVVLA